MRVNYEKNVQMAGELPGERCMRLANDIEQMRWIEAKTNLGNNILYLFVEILTPLMDPFHGESNDEQVGIDDKGVVGLVRMKLIIYLKVIA